MSNEWTELIKKVLGSELLYVEEQFDFTVFVVKPDTIYQTIKLLKEDSILKFEFLTTMCGLHYPDQKGRELGLMYQLHNLSKNARVRIKTFFPESNPEVKSIHTIFSTANWMEREAYDFYGIRFENHPDLRRILNMEDMKDFPLRKEFPLEDQTREDKADKMFGR